MTFSGFSNMNLQTLPHSFHKLALKAWESELGYHNNNPMPLDPFSVLITLKNKSKQANKNKTTL